MGFELNFAHGYIYPHPERPFCTFWGQNSKIRILDQMGGAQRFEYKRYDFAKKAKKGLILGFFQTVFQSRGAKKVAFFSFFIVSYP